METKFFADLDSARLFFAREKERQSNPEFYSLTLTDLGKHYSSCPEFSRTVEYFENNVRTTVTISDVEVKEFGNLDELIRYIRNGGEGSYCR